MGTVAGGGGGKSSTVKQLNVGGKLFSLEASSLSLSLSLDSPSPNPTFVDRDPALLSAILAAIRAPSSAAAAFPARVFVPAPAVPAAAFVAAGAFPARAFVPAAAFFPALEYAAPGFFPGIQRPSSRSCRVTKARRLWGDIATGDEEGDDE